MVLITGQVIRKYQIAEHREYKHVRDGETAYSKRLRDFDIISCCSVDGINFESRKISKSSQNSVVRPTLSIYMYVSMCVYYIILYIYIEVEDSLNDLGDRTCACQEKLEVLVRRICDLRIGMEKAWQARHTYIHTYINTYINTYIHKHT